MFPCPLKVYKFSLSWKRYAQVSRRPPEKKLFKESSDLLWSIDLE